MRLLTMVAAVLVAEGCASAPARPAPPPPQVTIEVFEGSLAPYGEWIVVGSYGRVWRPLQVGAGWQPYFYGEWVWTDDGWFWLTDEPWGWATYHYGRWAFDPAVGWFWVPGAVWGPAWVAWRVGDGFIGWAPLYPGYDVWWVDAYPLQPVHWVFVPTHRFVGARVDVVSLPRARAPDLVRTSRPAPPARERPAAQAPPLGGPARRVVEERVGRPVTPARVVAVPTPADARGRVERDSVPVYRPAPGAARARSEAAAPSRPAPAARPAPATTGKPGATPAPDRQPRPKREAPATTREQEGTREKTEAQGSRR